MTASKFEEVAATLTHRIAAGTYLPHQKLPSEYALASELAVSRLTVRKAVARLVQEQLLVKDPGRGTYVMDKAAGKIESGRLGLQGFTEAAKAYGQTTRTEVLSYRAVPEPSAEVQAQLALADRANPAVMELVRRRFWGDSPMTVEHLFLCREYVQGRVTKDFSGSLFALLEPVVTIAYSRQEIEAVLVDDTMGDLLGVAVGQPLLKVQSVAYTATATPIYFDTSYYRADKYKFRSTLTRLP